MMICGSCGKAKANYSMWDEKTCADCHENPPQVEAEIGPQTETRWIIQFPNGRYLKSGEYSQGIHTWSETSDPLRAMSTTKTHFRMFYKKLGCKLVTISISYNLIPMKGH